MKKIIIIFSVLLFFSGSCFAKQLSEKDIKLLQEGVSIGSRLQIVEIKVLDEIAKELKRANDLKEKELRAKGIY